MSTVESVESRQATGAPSGKSRLSSYLKLARPFTLLPPLLGIVSGAVCAFGSAHNPDPQARLTLAVVLTVALGSLCASFMNAASNAINQIYDLENDRINKPDRPLVTGAVGRREAWWLSIVLYVAAVPDVFQIPLERYVPHIVFERLQGDIPKQDLIKILFWVATHPNGGDDSAVDDLRSAGLKVNGPGDMDQTRERVMLYALKLLGRLVGKIPQ